MLRVNSRFNFSLRRQLLFLLLISLTMGCKSSKISKGDPIFTVIQTAKSYQGTPYRYGGTTRAGIDCSALIYHSYFAVGVTMPRISADQGKMGKKVNPRDLRQGDLLFFATGRRKNQVTHTGIVTEIDRGDIRFIHSSTSLGVSEDFLSNRYWSKAFLFARRVLE